MEVNKFGFWRDLIDNSIEGFLKEAQEKLMPGMGLCIIGGALFTLILLVNQNEGLIVISYLMAKSAIVFLTGTVLISILAIYFIVFFKIHGSDRK